MWDVQRTHTKLILNCNIFEVIKDLVMAISKNIQFNFVVCLNSHALC